ncbi:MAG TPA: hypothetical protein VJ743_17365 [Albitalea sp.]|nr:hypothetical protein [Albitalea sp.]
MQRRTLLKLGIGAAAVLAVAGGGIALLRPGLVNGRMTPASTTVFSAVARAVLDGALPQDAGASDAAIAAHLQRMDDTLAAFPAATQAELSQLLALLSSTAGRVGFVGLRSDWPQASVQDIQDALQSMRTSRLALRQQAYHALRDLTNAAYFADPQTWPLLGYPGPRVI